MYSPFNETHLFVAVHLGMLKAERNLLHKFIRNHSDIFFYSSSMAEHL